MQPLDIGPAARDLREAVRRALEAKGIEFMHRAGTWTGSESFVFAPGIQNARADHTDEFRGALGPALNSLSRRR